MPEQEPGESRVERVRLALYRTWAETGAAPDLETVAVATGSTVTDTRAALRLLHDRRHLVLDPGCPDRVVLAHPFSSTPLGFSVMGAATLWWGGCAWDSFAIPHLVDREPRVLVATCCPNCETAHAWVVHRDGPPAGGQVAHFLTPMSAVWNDVVRTCANQRLFCSADCVQAWLGRTGNDAGHTLDLSSLWHLARDWYTGRLEPGYARRDPAAAGAYFASIGLVGPFWQVT